MEGGAGGLIVGTSSRMWLPEARTDNFFTRPNAMPRMRQTLHLVFWCSPMESLHNSTSQLFAKSNGKFISALWDPKKAES